MSEEKYYTHDLSLHQLGSFYCCLNLKETTKTHLSCLLATLRLGSLFHKLTHLTKQNKVHRRLSLKFAREWSDIPSQDRFAQCCLSSPFPRCRKFWNSGTSQEEVFVALVRSREFCLGMFCRPGLCLRRVGGSCYHPQPVLLDHSLICSDKKVPGIFFSCHVHGMGRNLNSSSYPVKFKTSNEVYTVKRKTP